MTGDPLGVAGFVVTVLGLALTWWQARQGGVAARAARTAAESAVLRFSDLLLNSLLPDLLAAEREIRAAREADDHAAAIRAVARWRQLSAQVRGLLAQRGELSNDTGVVFSGSATLADDAERALVRRSGTVDEAVDDLLREMGDLAMRLSEVSVRILTEVPDAHR